MFVFSLQLEQYYKRVLCLDFQRYGTICRCVCHTFMNRIFSYRRRIKKAIQNATKFKFRTYFIEGTTIRYVSTNFRSEEIRASTIVQCSSRKTSEKSLLEQRNFMFLVFSLIQPMNRRRQSGESWMVECKKFLKWKR